MVVWVELDGLTINPTQPKAQNKPNPPTQGVGLDWVGFIRLVGLMNSPINDCP